MSGRLDASHSMERASASAQARMFIDLFSPPPSRDEMSVPTGSAAALAPLWAADALHRANNLAQMASALGSGRACKAFGGSAGETAITARALARAYAELGAREISGTVVPCRPLLEAIVTRLIELFRHGRAIELVLSLAEIELPAEKRRALTLIASELVINALKYAFHAECSGRLFITLAKTADIVELTVADNGGGFPDTYSSGSGSNLVQKLVLIMDGTICYSNTGNGLSISVIARISSS